MPTKNERISLLTDREEITAVKAPPPGLLRESKVIAVPGSGPLRAPGGDDGALTPAMIITEAPVMTAPRPGGNGRVTLGRITPATGRPINATPSATLSLPRPPQPAPAPTPTAPLAARPLTPQRSTPVQPAARVATPPASLPAALARMSMPVPIPPTLVASYQRPVVDLVPVSPGAGALAFAPPMLFPSPARSRAGLYAVLIALLAGGAGLVGWRQWSARPARVELTTTPADAIVTVDSETVLQHSPYTLERPPGSYEISVAREGYQPTHRTVELLAGQEVALAIALEAAHTAEVLPAAAVPAPHLARAQGAQGAGRHVPTGAGTAAALARHAPAPTAAPTAAAPDPGIAAMLARSHPLRDLSGAPIPAQASAPEAPASPVAEAPAPAAANPEESEPAAAPARAAAAEAVAAPASAPAATDRADARTVPGRVAKAQLAIDPNASDYRVALPPSMARADMKLAAVVKICVSTGGKVTDVKLLKSADAAVDPQILLVLSRWRFRPLLAGGRAVPFCYVTQYEISEP